ncbi:TVA1 protein, partial [Atractosteus spatula]|nr:TVA1 protein [Atractosteus spatula]
LTSHLFLFSCRLETAGGQSVDQSSSVTVKEQGDTTIPCSYKDPPTGFTMFWYVQTSGKAPEAIYNELLPKDSVPPRFQNRLSADHEKKQKTFHLQISPVELSDSSVYFCALQPTVRGAAPAPHRNLTLTASRGRILGQAAQGTQEWCLIVSKILAV